VHRSGSITVARAGDLCHSERTLSAGGELVCAFTSVYVLEHRIIHLELPTMHKPLVIAPKHLTVPCISESYLPSSLVDEVDIIMPELVLCSFVICLDTLGNHGDFWGDNDLCSVHQLERCLPRGPT
jgi:hypothetical protein